MVVSGSADRNTFEFLKRIMFSRVGKGGGCVCCRNRSLPWSAHLTQDTKSPNWLSFSSCTDVSWSENLHWMCIFRVTAFIFSLYFPLDLDNVQVSEKGLSTDSSVKGKKISKTSKNFCCNCKGGRIWNGKETIIIGLFFYFGVQEYFHMPELFFKYPFCIFEMKALFWNGLDVFGVGLL